jgi:hypothetical protein
MRSSSSAFWLPSVQLFGCTLEVKWDSAPDPLAFVVVSCGSGVRYVEWHGNFDQQQEKFFSRIVCRCVLQLKWDGMLET